MSSTYLSERFPAWLTPFFSLSYPANAPENPDSFPNSTYYNTGPLDICLVITCIAVMAILRDGLRLGVMEPFAQWKLSRDLNAKIAGRVNQQGYEKHRLQNGYANGHANGDGKTLANGNRNGNGNGHPSHTGNSTVPTRKELRQMRHSVLRFAEQGWSVIYYTLQWCYGLYVHRNLPTRVFDPTDLWLKYPHFPIAGPLKFYYLTQAAFYLHQVLIINAEARRKDHYQMMAHHVITIGLIGTSYLWNFNRIGCLIMVLMDWCDIFLPLAKMLRYLAYRTLCDITFTVFLVSWAFTRHICFTFIIKSTYSDAPRLRHFNWDPANGWYWSKQSWMCFVFMLSVLQVIQAIWFWMICRVAWRVISGQGATDERSDDESEDDKKER